MDNEGKQQIKSIEIKKQRANISQSKASASKHTASLSKIKDKKGTKEQKKTSISSSTSNNQALKIKSLPINNQPVKAAVVPSNYEEDLQPKSSIEKDTSKISKEADENEVFNNLVKNARKGDRVAFMNSIEM